jgi:nitrile hydratase accessory protein
MRADLINVTLSFRQYILHPGCIGMTDMRSENNRISGVDVTAIDAAAAPRTALSVPGLPCDAEGPVFREPWEAEAFAIVVALHQRGLFGWDEWAAMLGEEIKAAQRAGDPDTGETYYRHWLAALERMVARKGIADPAALKRYHDAWQRAADRTAHGAPIALTAGDFAAD